jgi:hypothetical protein
VIYGGFGNRVNVRNWYLWLSAQQTVVVRVMSPFAISDLWQEQIDAINETVASLQVKLEE